MEYLIELNNVSFTYEKSKKPAVSNINLKVRKGETIVISGHAGAGKSTICRMLNGLIPHYYQGELEGQVLVADYDTRAYQISSLSHIVGELFDDPANQLLAPTVEDEVAFGLENYGVPTDEIIARVTKSIKLCRLQGYELRDPHTLSGGQQQSCVFASIMAMSPSILVLDEPTTCLDPIGSDQVYSLINDEVKKRECTVILTDNNLEKVMSIADRLIVLDHGKIVLEGEPGKVVERMAEATEGGIKPPPISELFYRLKRDNFKVTTIPITLESGVREMRSIFSNGVFSTKRLKERHNKNMSACKDKTTAIETKNLWHVYPGGTKALRGVSVKIYYGQLTGIIGQNGSGKTTLVKHFNGLLKPTEGEVYTNGKDTRNATVSELAKEVGFVFQNPDHQIFGSSCKEEIEYGPRNIGIPMEELEERVRNALKATYLYPDILDQNPFNLSTSEKKRLNIASVLAMTPRILIVDEPTTGQDPQMRKQIMVMLKSLLTEAKCIIVITHDINLVSEFCDRCVVLCDGKILLDGAPGEVFSQTETLKKTFVHPPQIMQLGQALHAFNVPNDISTVDEMYRFIVNGMR